jgi:hypothetical protein
MKGIIHPNYTKSGKTMISVEITLLIDEDEEEGKIKEFLKATKENGSLTISGLPTITGKNLAVDTNWQ